ncbi:ABC transporter ATP-binding protein [Pseudomonas sp. LFM046]|uniref:ABC transporter ATP-binding protein n=1 Tax=Pseudomonas sp. LFM046 TaxID=1608357 RepID=UPI0005CFA52D|nr:ABC transporter ATP-binding protein [Pseudomonas sp. LFM046]
MQGNIAIRDVYKGYGSFIAIDHVSLDVHAGEFLTLLGPSGSGKTTLLNVLAGFIRPDSGRIKVDGVEFLTRPPHKRDVGMVFQNYALFPHMTVAENVAYPLRLRKVGGADRVKRVKAALEMVQMDHLGERGIHQLSGGQRQRVALARAMVFEPKILLMDEPLSALDKNLREHMQLELKRLHARLGMTTIYVTHDQKEALTLSHRIAVLNKGKLAQLDTPDALYERPTDRFVAGFIGESCFLEVEEGSGGVMLQGRPLKLPQGTATRHPQKRVLMVRPERLQWQISGDGHAMNRIQGTARDVVYQGDSYHVGLVLPDGTELTARHQKGFRDVPVPVPGAPVELWLHAEDTLLVAESA